MNLTCKESKIASDVTAPLPVTRGIERTFSRPFSETFRISKNEDFSGPYLENENEFLKNSFETVFRASKSCDRDQLVSAFQLTFKGVGFAFLDGRWWGLSEGVCFCLPLASIFLRCGILVWRGPWGLGIGYTSLNPISAGGGRIHTPRSFSLAIALNIN